MKTQTLPARPYVIMNPSGAYYTGTVRTPWESNFTPSISLAFVYSYETAWKDIHFFPSAFAGCVAIELPAPSVIK